MAKTSSIYVCQQCGYEAFGWLGRCPSCQAWGSLIEERVPKRGSATTTPSRQRPWLDEKTDTVVLSAIDASEDHRIKTSLDEVDRVLGGGFVPGSLVLLSGDPGIGKSTLLLQICHRLSREHTTLYVSGEESKEQIRLRAERLHVRSDDLLISTQTLYEQLSDLLIAKRPAFLIVDSIQTMYAEALSAAPGSVSQVREVTAGLLRLAKDIGMTVVLVGHVTKDGAIAGPRVLEHMVDTVLYFEAQNASCYRMLRSEKNRFGPAGEIAFFEMRDNGLSEVENASTLLLSGRPIGVPGSAVTPAMNGSRPLMIEIQALVSPSVFSVAQKMTQGLERNRVSMLLAVLEKQLKAGLLGMDVYINVVGGLRITEPSVDLAVISAIFSTLQEKPLRSHMMVLGEVGLTGEIRPVGQIARRLSDVRRMGFDTCLLPGSQKSELESICDPEIDLIYVDHVSEALDVMLA